MNLVIMKQQSLQILQKAQVGSRGDSVAGEVEVLQVDILVEILDGLDVVVGEGEPGQQVHLLQQRVFIQDVSLCLSPLCS